MLRSTADMLGYLIKTTDAGLGKLKDLYFDDEWTVRHLIVDTGVWLPGRRVLVSPVVVVGEPDGAAGVLPVSLTKEQLEKALSIQSGLPVARQHEVELLDYYRWASCWGGAGYLGSAVPVPARCAETADGDQDGDPRLRSVREVTGYRIQATDGDIGHVEDFVAETDGWVIRYMVADTRNWLPGRKVLIAPPWIGEVSRAGRHVRVGLTREGVKESAEFDPGTPVNRGHAGTLYDYYGRPVYGERAAGEVGKGARG